MNKFKKIESYPFSAKSIANCTWIMNRYCNYSCSYCWPHAHQQKKDFFDEDTYLLAVYSIISQFKNNGYDSVWWSFTGGEVTFNPWFLSVLDEITQGITDKNKMAINLTTNLSQSEKWWLKFSTFVDKFKHKKINASWHGEYINSPDKLNKFKNKLLLLRDNDIKVVVNTVLTPGKLEEQKRLVEYFNKEDIYVLVKGARGNYVFLDGLEKQDFDFIKAQASLQEKQLINRKGYIEATYLNDAIKRFKSYEEVLAENYESYDSWYCTAGHQAITIFENGDVCRGRSCKKEKLGSILTGFNLFKNVERCRTKNPCTCTGDLKMPKWRDNENNLFKVG